MQLLVSFVCLSHIYVAFVYQQIRKCTIIIIIINNNNK